MRTGISLYFASGYEANAEVVAKRRQSDATMHSLRYRFPRKRGLIIALRLVDF